MKIFFIRRREHITGRYEEGGISDRPNDEPDVYHTFFGIAGLSLMGFPGLKAVDPVYALPVEVVKRIGLYD